MLCMLFRAWTVRRTVLAALSGFGKLGKVLEDLQFRYGIEMKHLNDQMAA